MYLLVDVSWWNKHFHFYVGDFGKPGKTNLCFWGKLLGRYTAVWQYNSWMGQIFNKHQVSILNLHYIFRPFHFLPHIFPAGMCTQMVTSLDHDPKYFCFDHNVLTFSEDCIVLGSIFACPDSLLIVLLVLQTQIDKSDISLSELRCLVSQKNVACLVSVSIFKYWEHQVGWQKDLSEVSW